MNFGNLLNIQPDIKSVIRNIETPEKKLAYAKIAVIFNNACLNENLLPRFSNIYKHVWLKTVAILMLTNLFSMPSIFIRLPLILSGWQNNKFPKFVFVKFVKRKK